MSGSRLVLDTNAIVALLGGSRELDRLLTAASWVGVSVISRLEFLAYAGLSSKDESLFGEFCGRVETVWLSAEQESLLAEATRIRRQYQLKLPDALIAATALVSDAALVTADTDFERVEKLEIVNPST